LHCSSADEFNHLHANEQAEEDFNKWTSLNFYREAFTDSRNFLNAVRKYLVPRGFIQHNPELADGREPLIAGFFRHFKKTCKDHIDFIAHVIADENLLWVHERNSYIENNLSVSANIVR